MGLVDHDTGPGQSEGRQDRLVVTDVQTSMSEGNHVPIGHHALQIGAELAASSKDRTLHCSARASFDPPGVVRMEPLLIAGVGADCVKPTWVAQIPVHRFAQSFGKRVPRLPTKFPAYSRRVHCIAAVMPRTVCHELNERTMRSPW